MLKKFIFSAYLFINISLFSQIGGENVYQFLNLPTSARQIALGGETLTLLEDINQPMWNPSIIDVEIDNQISLNYTSYLAGINLGSLSYARLINRRFGVIHGHITYLNYGSIIGADEQGNETGNFNASDLLLAVGYSYNIPRTNFYVGANVKFITSTISSFSSTGIATDIGLTYNNPYKPYSIALVVRNLGTQISTFSGTKEKLPLKVSLSGSYQLEHVPLKWYLTLDNLQQWNVAMPNPSNQTSDLEGNITQEEISFLTNTLRHFVVGAELFPESAINLRLGYNFRRSAELQLQNVRSFGGISFGFGIRMNRFKFDYAFSKFHSASNSSTFSLQMNLDRY